MHFGGLVEAATEVKMRNHAIQVSGSGTCGSGSDSRGVISL
jgi:hypothetical protein